MLNGIYIMKTREQKGQILRGRATKTKFGEQENKNRFFYFVVTLMEGTPSTLEGPLT